MGHQPPALEKLFDEWAKKHAENLSQEAPYFVDHEAPFGKFVRDGIVNFDNWKKQKVRICFVLHEASGYADNEKFPNGHDVAAEWNEKGAFSKFMFKLAVWTKAVNDAFAAVPSTYVKKEVVAIRHDLIRSIAIVNIKKSDGQMRPNFELVKNFASVDAEELRRELEIINANIIIFGDNYFYMVGERPQPEEGAPEDAPPPKRIFPIYQDEVTVVSKFAYSWNNKLLLRYWTPANFKGTLSSNTINYYAVREITRAALKIFGQKKPPVAAKPAPKPAPKPAAPAPAPAAEPAK